ncbi:MAG: hypothetical protein JSV05_03660 [Candidatus Bathyarchaeota archaeon]|nr:MAG: hypothetical protein JSV05_03660 [Candidatus Bathyarchaeota archaeon]
MRGLALLSGGLDSTLATKLLQEQGIDVVAINFKSPFCLCGKGGCGAAGIAKQLGVHLKTITIGEEYLEMIRNPKHGYGKNMNPCIDCRIFMLKKAKEMLKELGASFLFTGEVLGQRPMSQHRKALEIIEKEAGLEGMILRPLSAKSLPETEAERKGWVDREKLLDISGRSRKLQLQLASDFGLRDFPCPAGGCLLTSKEFAMKIKDLFKYNKQVTLNDISLLKIGRHFRFGKNKIIVGRNEAENKQLMKLKQESDYFFEVPNCGSPITLLQGQKGKVAIEKAAALTLRYSDQKDDKAIVLYNSGNGAHSIIPSALTSAEIDNLRIK